MINFQIYKTNIKPQKPSLIKPARLGFMIKPRFYANPGMSPFDRSCWWDVKGLTRLCFCPDLPVAACIVDKYQTLLKLDQLYLSSDVISNNVVFFTSVDSDEPVQHPFKLRNSK